MLVGMEPCPIPRYTSMTVSTTGRPRVVVDLDDINDNFKLARDLSQKSSGVLSCVFSTTTVPSDSTPTPTTYVCMTSTMLTTMTNVVSGSIVISMSTGISSPLSSGANAGSAANASSTGLPLLPITFDNTTTVTSNSNLTTPSVEPSTSRTSTTSTSTYSTLSPNPSPTPAPASTSTTSSPGPPSGLASSGATQRQTHAAAGVNAGAVAGGVIAALTGIFILTCCFLLLRRRRRRAQAQTQTQDIEPSLIPDALTTCNDTRAIATSHGSPALFTSTSANTPLAMAQWATAELPRQHEILLRENSEFWEEIQRLREENEHLKGRAGVAPVAF